MTILVTGGAGYIGSHAVRTLRDHSYRVVVLDNLVYGHRDLVERLGVPLVVGQVGNRQLLDQLLRGAHPACAGEPIQAVMHFAAYAYVGESVEQPERYYRNNLGDSLTLVEALLDEAALVRFPWCSQAPAPPMASLPMVGCRSRKAARSSRSIPMGAAS